MRKFNDTREEKSKKALPKVVSDQNVEKDDLSPIKSGNAVHDDIRCTSVTLVPPNIGEEDHQDFRCISVHVFVALHRFF